MSDTKMNYYQSIPISILKLPISAFFSILDASYTSNSINSLNSSLAEVLKLKKNTSSQKGLFVEFFIFVFFRKLEHLILHIGFRLFPSRLLA